MCVREGEEHNALLNFVVREGLAEKVTFELRPEGGKGESPACWRTAAGVE